MIPSARQQKVIINSNGVYLDDARGNRYYYGYQQTKLSMISYYFEHAKQFWNHQTINGVPLELQEIRVQTAANSSVPYNFEWQTRRTPIATRDVRKNRVAWYNIKFNVGETGWICNKLYMTLFDAATNIAAETAHQLYNDQRVIDCVRNLITKQATR